ncbi:hypothetical protein [Pseudomonas sp. Leaf58]|uniref:hypothetical protein n=1 Tax=Pseudomonas sp. Leaf58 TaxID=1736226 RepID=UPI001F31BBFB|nr:hypothetical protein [Pseudomonas sp. Leaf58]
MQLDHARLSDAPLTQTQQARGNNLPWHGHNHVHLFEQPLGGGVRNEKIFQAGHSPIMIAQLKQFVATAVHMRKIHNLSPEICVIGIDDYKTR